ncbi:peptidoglycan-binding protein [Streptomyces caeni]|uniref:Peptidoglycan-binding protein n=1 Tax=Streptomyces caeni TaxID=2307231 RepID=A0ABW4IVI4_9ACTN
MSGTNGRTCPECAAPRRPDGTPSCACTRRASDALRDARTADAATAEDFDPLRIRPYVELEVTAAETQAPVETEVATTRTRAPASSEPAARESPGGAAEPDETMQLAAVRDGSGRAPAPADETMRLAALRTDDSERAPASADRTMRLAAVTDDGTGRRAAAPEGSMSPGIAPDETMRLTAVPSAPAGPERADGTAPRRPLRPRRTTVLLAAGGAVAAVVATAGIAGGLFSYDPPERARALPEDIRASVPEKPSDGPTTPAPTASSATPSASPAPSPSDSPSPSASPSTASPSPSPSATASHAPPAQTTATASPATNEKSAPVLRPGDRGPEVTELQLRLRQVGLYFGPADGNYGRHVEYAVRNYQFGRGIRQDAPGVYGPATRARLESETTQP